MIVKILSSGKSFKGLATYLTHDPEAKTNERVGWTHTLNLANDHVPSAVDEMLWTARNAELLKQEAGIRAGGRATENPVKHLSLNWAPDDKPTREHMIETTEDFLRHMKWQEHQAVLVAHNEKAFAHVHVILNVIHSETGLRLDDNFERRRAQAWALEYERERGHIYCEQRLLNPAEREDAPTRPAWRAFEENQKRFEHAEKLLRNNDAILIGELKKPENASAAEWKKLKEIQRDERQEFFADGKSAFSELRLAIYREVREDYRERWRDLYAAKKNGADISDLKAELVADQKATLEARRDEACTDLRESRNAGYRELLDEQREARLGLRWRQEAGFENALFLQEVESRSVDKNMTAAFREAAGTATSRDDATANDAFMGWSRNEKSGVKSGADVGANIGTGLGFSAISFLESLVDGFIGARPDPRPRQPEPELSGPNPFEAGMEDARKQQHDREREEAEGEWLKRQRSLYGE